MTSRLMKRIWDYILPPTGSVPARYQVVPRVLLCKRCGVWTQHNRGRCALCGGRQ